MNWIVWSVPFLSGALDASTRVVIKKTPTNRYHLGGFGFLCAVPFYLIWLSFYGLPSVDHTFWLAIAGVVCIGFFAALAMIEAHRNSSFSLVAPYLSLTPAFSLLVAPFFHSGITPTHTGIAGIGVMVAGTYILNCSISKEYKGAAGHVGLLTPFARVWQDKGSRLMVLVSLLLAFTINIDPIGFSHSNKPFYMTVNHSLLGIMLLTAGIADGRAGITGRFKPSRSDFAAFVGYGAFTAVQLIMHMESFNWIPSATYIVAVKRAGAIILTITAGYVLARFSRNKEKYKDETKDRAYRITGTILMLIGMVIVISYGLPH